MNIDSYPHAGNPLNKTILREILPKVYPGTGWFTVEELRAMAETYHRRNEGKDWEIRERHAPVYNVLREYERDGRAERQKVRTPHRWRFIEEPGAEPLEGYLDWIREEIAFLTELLETITERKWELENVLAAEEWSPP